MGIFMKFDKEAYKKFTSAHAPKSHLLKNTTRAFLVGGAICLFGEFLNYLYSEKMGMVIEDATLLTAVTLVFLSILLTGLGMFDNIAKFAGAGTLVPITGFANAVASPAIDSKSEGLVLGIGSKIFTVAGPVLLYGTVAGAIYGVIYYIIGLII